MASKEPVTSLRAPLHVHVATLFIVLVLAVGAAMVTLQYLNTSRIIKGSSEQTVDLMVRYIQNELTRLQQTVGATLDLMHHSDIIHTHEWLKRQHYLPWLQQLLRNHQSVSAFIFGFPDGDVLMLKPIHSPEQRQRLQAPDKAEFVLDHIDREDDKLLEARRYYFSADLNLIKESRLIDHIFDPRVRPWYQLALRSDNQVFTPPYIFYSSKNIGITMAQATKNKVVVAADFTLLSLSKLLATFPLPKDSVISLYDNQGQVLGYPVEKQMQPRLTGHALRTPMLYELNSPILERLAMPLLSLTGEHAFEYNDQTWLADIRDVTFLPSLPIKLAVLIPEQNLLTDALALRRQSTLVTLAILLLAIPLAWLLSRFVSTPLRQLVRNTASISAFRFDQVKTSRSMVLEIDDLSHSIKLMNDTIAHFLQLIESLAEEKQLDALLAKVANETRATTGANAALLLLCHDEQALLVPRSVSAGAGALQISPEDLPELPYDDAGIHAAITQKDIIQQPWEPGNALCQTLQRIVPEADAHLSQVVVVPLINRDAKIVGALTMLFQEDDTGNNHSSIESRLPFIKALCGFTAVSVETRQLILHQKKLFSAFIELIAGAIDAKSAYTGGHCQRVPELTEMLAQAACESKEPPFDQFDLNDEEWEALHVAGWLHDCGKVTTPEHVVDKATKLEARYDRIHEIRMRFEVLKKEAERDYWQTVAMETEDPQQAKAKLQQTWQQLDKEFAFVAQCNQGGEFLTDNTVQQLQSIAQRTWTRTLNDRIGISWEEAKRKAMLPEPELPTQEPLLQDRADHLIPHENATNRQENNFNLVPPAHKYNLGEIHNLTIARGTLTDEERFHINDHIVQTILMLECLPYPDHLKAVPAIAGGHHEKMDGSGYPRGLYRQDMPATARMMAIADVYEALTAADRPYKQAKTISECLAIMQRMAQEQHLDPQLFYLFIESGVYRDYAKRFLKPEQIDTVDEAALLESLRVPIAELI